MYTKSNEKQVQKSITDYLDIKQYFYYRNNSGAFKDPRGHLYRFGAIGSPDIICVILGRFIGIECKDKSKQSDAQIEFQKKLEAAGGLYILARSVDDLIKNGL